MDSDRLQPALWGGLFIGVLSSLPFVNCCCCLWVIAGGALAVYVRQQNLPVAIAASEGALVGLLAGVIGGIIAVPLGFAMSSVMAPFQSRLVEWAMSANPELPSDMRDNLQQLIAQQRALSVFRSILAIGVDAVFGMLGGLLGVALFRKNAPPPPPPGTVEVLPPV